MTRRVALALFLLASTWSISTASASDRRLAIVVLDEPCLAEHLVATQPPEERLEGRELRGRLFAPEADNYRERLRLGKRSLATRLAARGIILESQTEIVLNALVVRATEEELDWLRAQPGVRRAEFAPEYRLMLDAALLLVGAPQAWAAVGGEDNAGRGVKIAIIDSGIDQSHPMMNGAGLAVPQGFPKFGKPDDAAFTNNKVIVARNYSSDAEAVDRSGHGTFVSAVAAGQRADSPLGSIAGVAPGAFVGNYKVFNVQGESGNILVAIEDAVRDGMDIINLSLGSPTPATKLPQLDDYYLSIQNAARLGIIVVVAAGNHGPGPRTLSSPGIIPEAITVGATSNSRRLVRPFRVTAPEPVPAALQGPASEPGSDPISLSPVGPAPLVDVSQLDSSGLACGALPPASLGGKIALVKRGDCFFRDKIRNAANAGAIGVVVYDNVVGRLFIMNTSGATIPSILLSNSDGLALLAFVRANPSTAQALLGAQLVSTVPDAVTDFSSRGPSTDFGIKPDLVAPGENIFSATQNRDSQGELFSSIRYLFGDGTSFSSPMVAGGAALLRQARPRLTNVQVKSALVNTAVPVTLTEDGAPISVMNAGAGKMTLPAALAATLVAQPVSLSFGSHSPRDRANDRQSVRLTNVGTAAETFAVSVVPRLTDPALRVDVDRSTVTLNAGESVSLNVSLSNTATLQSDYEGFLNIRSQAGSTVINVPYWTTFAVPEVFDGGVVNGASFRREVSPGSLVSVFGLALGGKATSARSLPLTGNLGGTAFRVNASDASGETPLVFSSAGQINAQLPFNLAAGTATARVRFNGVDGLPFSFQVAPYSPGIFSLRQDGTGPGAILHANGALVDARNPAQAGEFVSVFCTGLGAVNSPPPKFDPAKSDPLSLTLVQPVVTIGGQTGAVQFSGLAPGFVGLYQVNVQIPNGVPPGEQQLVMSIGGATSNAVTIPVQ